MFALFTLSPMEILILGSLCVGPVILGVVWLLVLRPTARGQYPLADRESARVEESQRRRIMELEAENDRLRAEIERLRRGGQPPETFTRSP
jgi:hypothetical protein